MTRRQLLCAAALCVVLTGTALAADISGNWAGSLQMGDSPLAVTFAFKQAGEKLTGTVTTPSGDLPLTDGKVVGNKVSFVVEADNGGSPAKYISQGVIKGDEITLSTKIDGGEDFGSWVVKRVK